MATSNLIRKTIGGIELQTGNGIPNHTATKGSNYTDLDTGKGYYSVGGTTWHGMSEPAVIEGVNFDNEPDTTNITINTQNVWEEVGNNGDFTWSTDVWPIGGIGVTGQAIGATNSALEISTDGTYMIFCGGTFQYDFPFSEEIVELGFGINGADPSQGDYQSGLALSTAELTSVFIKSYKVLNSGDIIQMYIRNTTNADDLDMQHGYIRAVKIG
jgi:hypothetical protein